MAAEFCKFGRTRHYLSGSPETMLRYTKRVPFPMFENIIFLSRKMGVVVFFELLVIHHWVFKKIFKKESDLTVCVRPISASWS